MRTKDLRVNMLSSEAYEWYLTYLRALDTKDLAAYGAFLSDDCVLLMNNGPQITGRTAIVAALGQFWSTFGTLEHDLLNLYGTDSSFCLEALNHYTTLDGGSVTLRIAAFVDRDGHGRVEQARLYSDTSRLFAPAP